MPVYIYIFFKSNREDDDELAPIERRRAASRSHGFDKFCVSESADFNEEREDCFPEVVRHAPPPPAPALI